MTSISISSEIQASPNGLSSSKAVSPAAGATGSAPLSSHAASGREPNPAAVDTVTLRNKVTHLPGKDADAVRNSRPDNQVRAMSDILFSYNFKGDLRIRFMDSSNELVYQTPSENMTRMADLMMSRKSTVNTIA